MICESVCLQDLTSIAIDSAIATAIVIALALALAAIAVAIATASMIARFLL